MLAIAETLAIAGSPATAGALRTEWQSTIPGTLTAASMQATVGMLATAGRQAIAVISTYLSEMQMLTRYVLHPHNRQQQRQQMPQAAGTLPTAVMPADYKFSRVFRDTAKNIIGNIQ
jgi:hypothetical protein